MQQKPHPEEQRNLIIAAVLSIAVLFLWQVFVVGPQLEEQREQQAAFEAAREAEAARNDGAEGDGADAASLDGATAAVARVPLRTDRLEGSISLRGGRLDDLHLVDYRVSLDDAAPAVRLLSPANEPNGYYAVYGWVSRLRGVETPTPATVWELESGDALTPGQSVTLKWDNGAGLTFRRTISVDDRYLFTIEQSVENATEQDALLYPYGLLVRHGAPQLEGMWIQHEGAIGVLNDLLTEYDYDDLDDLDVSSISGLAQVKEEEVKSAPGGWLGFTDKYWLTAMVPSRETPFTAAFREEIRATAAPVYRTDIRLPDMTIGPGERIAVETRLFAGAKELEAIRDYQYQFDGVAEPTGFLGKLNDFFFYSSQSRFVDTIDWGWFFFLTKPIFEILLWLNSLIGNMGVAIILLTVIFKTLVFPLAYKSYVSMSKMKQLQPEMKELQERYPDDKMKLQQEMIALYKRERVNPASGCLPILLQIPIFFSLYKVLFVCLEMRHAPFFGWIQDLSAPDPTSIFNLFGLLPYEVPAFLLIGIWPVLMGITMWLQQLLNPAPADPMQERIFNLLPILFTFLLGTFASGLVIYWTANNVFTIIQQYTIMRSQGVEVDLLGNVKKKFKRRPKTEESS